MTPPTGEERQPYAGPPPTTPYGAPPHVAGAAGHWNAGPWQPPPPWQVPPWQAAPWQAAPWQPPPWQFAPPYPRGWHPGPWGPPPLPLALPKGTPPHDLPRSFLQIMRSRDWAWWRPLLGLLLFAVVYTVAVVLVVVFALLAHATPDLAMTDLSDPAVLLITNLTLIVAIPAVWLVWVAVHGMGRGWSESVLARLRLRLFRPFTGRALVTIGAAVVISGLIGLIGDPGSVHGPGSDFGWLVLVVLLTTPLQSAAEEYFFRGYFSQAIAGWIRSPRAGAITAALITATLFSLAHGPADIWAFLDRFAFGLAASCLVWLTGGLEASIVLHAVNNVLVFLLAGLLGQAVSTDDSSGSGAVIFLVLDVGAMAAYVWLVARCRDRLRPETHTAALDLRLPGPAGPGVLPLPAGASGMVVSGVAPPSGYPAGPGAPRHPWGMG